MVLCNVHIPYIDTYEWNPNNDIYIYCFSTYSFYLGEKFTLHKLLMIKKRMKNHDLKMFYFFPPFFLINCLKGLGFSLFFRSTVLSLNC